jgi:hypothetical protein
MVESMDDCRGTGRGSARGAILPLAGPVSTGEAGADRTATVDMAVGADTIRSERYESSRGVACELLCDALRASRVCVGVWSASSRPVSWGGELGGRGAKAGLWWGDRGEPDDELPPIDDRRLAGLARTNESWTGVEIWLSCRGLGVGRCAFSRRSLLKGGWRPGRTPALDFGGSDMAAPLDGREGTGRDGTTHADRWRSEAAA